ncbi:hypothetical protein V5O48_004555 [Marasmius crinis-equi]|uniref:Uncharacterized protein n=1 Tax=Marasmius crinis-equi TaxID=585013 RepID=A0ABR3FPT4_9AGAR
MHPAMKLPWTGSDITFGSGFDINTRQLKPTALNPFKPTQDHTHPKISVSSYTLDTADDVMEKIHDEVHASVCLKGETVEACGTFLRNVNVSKNAMCKVFRTTVEDPVMRGKQTEFKLDEKAKKILEGPEGPGKFVEEYGHYFVYGRENKSSFAAACNFSSDSMDAITALVETSLGEDIDQVDSSPGLTRARNQMKSSRGSDIAAVSVAVNTIPGVNTAVDVELFGFQAPEGIDANAVTIDDASEIFQKFIDEAKPAPYMALLLPYSMLDSRIPSPAVEELIANDPSQKVTLMLQHLYLLHFDVVSHPMERVQKLVDKVAKASDEVLRVNPSDSQAMEEWAKKIDRLAEEAKAWKDRDLVLKDALKLTTLNYVRKDEWIRGLVRPAWTQGIMIEAGNPVWDSISNDIRIEERSWNPEWSIIAQEHEFTLGSEDRLILGWQVLNNRRDGANGAWMWKNGKVLESHFRVAFRTQSFHGASFHSASWTVRVWTVDRALYTRV